MHARSSTGTQGTMLLIAISAAACTPLEHRSSDPAYVAEDIDVVAGTIKDKKLSELVDVKVVLSGLVKTSSGKRPLMYLSHDRSKIDEELAKTAFNC